MMHETEFSVVLASYDTIVLAKVIADTWEHADIATMK